MKTKTIQLTMLLLTLALSNIVIAEETVKNEHKNNRTRNPVSNADPTSNTGSDITVNVNTRSTSPSLYRQNKHQDRRIHEQMERRRQMQEAQLEAYKNYLQSKRLNDQAFNQQLPIEAQARHSTLLKLMEERRTLMKKMMELQRQAAEERRNARLQRINQTSITSEKITLKQM